MCGQARGSRPVAGGSVTRRIRELRRSNECTLCSTACRRPHYGFDFGAFLFFFFCRAGGGGFFFEIWCCEVAPPAFLSSFFCFLNPCIPKLLSLADLPLRAARRFRSSARELENAARRDGCGCGRAGLLVAKRASVARMAPRTVDHAWQFDGLLRRHA